MAELEKILCTDSRIEAAKKINAIVDAMGEGDLANIDLSNLSSTGQAKFDEKAYANEVLKKAQITNCLLEVPQNIKLELNNGTLTLKAGSKAIVPNGAGVFDEVVTTTDLTIAQTSNDTYVVCLTTNGSVTQARLKTQTGSGTTTPTSSWWIYYNTTDNKVYRVNDGATQSDTLSFPIAIFTVTNGVISSIDQVFNGFGYIGNTIFCDKGVKGLIPNGRNLDGTLNNIEFVTNKIQTYTDTYARTNQALVLSASFFGPAATYIYDEKENYGYREGIKYFHGHIGYITKTATTVTDFQPKLPFRAVDYNDLENYVKGMPVGTVFSHTCSASFVPENSLPCNGSEYTQVQFPNLYNDWLVGGKLKTCTYTEYSNMLTTYGQCPMWALDTTNKKFKVPTIKDGAVIQQAKSDSEIGKAYNAGLPNIVGQFRLGGTEGCNIQNGAFQSLGDGGSYGEGHSSGARNPLMEFNASRSSSIYGNSTTVQMNAVALRYFVVVATKSINQSAMDWSQWASSINGKLNADHSNDTKPYITQTYVNGASWYRVWSDKWCEQGNTFTITANNAPITLLKPYTSSNYNLQLTCGDTDTNANVNGVAFYNNSKTNSSFNIVTGYNDKFFEVIVSWQACGYIS